MDYEEFIVKVKVGARGIWIDVPVIANTELHAEDIIEKALRSLEGENPSRPTNVAFVKELMEFSRFGALTQAFILQAIDQFSKQVAASDPAKYPEVGLVSPEVWIGIAKEVQTKLAKRNS